MGIEVAQLNFTTALMPRLSPTLGKTLLGSSSNGTCRHVVVPKVLWKFDQPSSLTSMTSKEDNTNNTLLANVPVDLLYQALETGEGRRTGLLNRIALCRQH